ncbi:hypothetical protein TSAR_004483 [Trichomalopsis sarcophagae]|uniref:TIR domain-containing protein n=1 Tax=Trichomalopsis sarcophagae TaxID=543379 RepID=A0A232FI58_9HYME|nr:hypothetical protein TSAR_004483 [Trichomalopsis sarcophagae]
MVRFALPLAVILIFAVSSTSDQFSCPKHLPCYCFMSAMNEYKIHCAINSTANSAFDITIQPGNKVRIQCKNSPDWSQFLLGSAIVVGPVVKFEFDSCAPPGPMYSAKIVDWQINALGVEYLKYEDFSAPLTVQDLKVFTELKHLVLSYNKLGQLQRNLLRGLPNLKRLELKNTSIAEIPQGFFDNSSSLRTLELNGNKLESLTPGVFDRLKQIDLLNLGQNNLHELKPDVFRNLQNLTALDIQMNNLKTLPANIFADLKSLEVIEFGGNNFTSLPADLFQFNPELKIVNHSNNTGNLTTLPGKFLSGFANLKVVSLAHSGIHYLPEDLLWGSTSMIELNLNENYLKKLPTNLLKDAAELHTLSLSSNDLEFLEAGTFFNNKKLVQLDLSKNRLTFIKEYTFAGLECLQELNMQHNDLTYINIDAFASLEQLKIAKFANNKLTLRTDVFDLFGQISPFHACASLEVLDLAHNNIEEIFSDWMVTGTNLRTVDLSYNKFEKLQAADFQFTSNRIKVDLSHNNIQLLNLTRLEFISTNQIADKSNIMHPRNVIVFLSSNPIQCDCKLYDLVRYLNNQMDLQAQEFVKLNVKNMTCDGPEHMAGLVVEQLETSAIKCRVQSPKAQKDDPCATNSTCECWMRPSDDSLLLDCARRNLTSPPAWIDTRGYDRVELDLSRNELRTGPNMSAKGYDKVVSLNLAENKITDVEVNLITPNLKILNLEGNNLTSLNSEVLKKLFNVSNISQLTLRNNPWICNCSSRDLLSNFQMGYKQISDFVNVTCQNSTVFLSRLSIDELCQFSDNLIIIAGSLASLFVLLMSCVVALYFCFGKQIKIWLYSKNLVTEREVDKGKIYDAFVSYSHKVEEFVVKELVAKLEEGPRPYKICIHIPDWLAGEWIPVQISRSFDDSRGTIIVLSPNFIESVWARMEFQAAYKRALSEKCARVIIIVYGEIGPIDDLDTDLRSYLTMNTYVKWGDPWFWQKLKYALPHSVIRSIITDKENNCVSTIDRTIVSKQINQLQVTLVIEKSQTVVEDVEEISQSISNE